MMNNIVLMIQYSLRNELFGNLNKGDKETDKKDEMLIVSQESLVKKIYIIRGQKVMLDFELAEIYGYETKRFNEQVIFTEV